MKELWPRTLGGELDKAQTGHDQAPHKCQKRH